MRILKTNSLKIFGKVKFEIKSRKIKEKILLLR